MLDFAEVNGHNLGMATTNLPSLARYDDDTLRAVYARAGGAATARIGRDAFRMSVLEVAACDDGTLADRAGGRSAYLTELALSAMLRAFPDETAAARWLAWAMEPTIVVTSK